MRKPYMLKVPTDVWEWGIKQMRTASLEERVKWEAWEAFDDPANKVIAIPAECWEWAQKETGLDDPGPFLIELMQTVMRGAKKLGH